MQGELLQTDDRVGLRFNRRLTHSPEKVWRAITEPEHLRSWFPGRIVGAWTVGSRLEFQGEYPTMDGEVLAVEEGSLLEFRWGPDTLRFEIAPEDDGSTLTLTHTFDEVGKAARDAAGWHECLDRLSDHLDGRPLRTWGEGWSQAHARYVAAFGPEASSIGPPDRSDGGS
ncbi:MAG TPA: SRPBCC family protein [Acidimicrobiales bacterium]|nr:SRPBCC family protein [Acidimicrobiales bacterium]